MVDSKAQKLNIGEITRNSEMLEFVADHLKTKKMCKHTVNMLPFLVKYIPERYNI